MARAIHSHPIVVRSLPEPGDFQCLLERQGLYLQGQLLATLGSLVSIHYPIEGVSSGCNELHFSSLLICDGLRPLHSCGPAHYHAAQRVPPVVENQNHMRDNKENEEPHEPEMPYTRFVKASK